LTEGTPNKWTYLLTYLVNSIYTVSKKTKLNPFCGVTSGQPAGVQKVQFEVCLGKQKKFTQKFRWRSKKLDQLEGLESIFLSGPINATGYIK